MSKNAETNAFNYGGKSSTLRCGGALTESASRETWRRNKLSGNHPIALGRNCAVSGTVRALMTCTCSRRCAVRRASSAQRQSNQRTVSKNVLLRLTLLKRFLSQLSARKCKKCAAPKRKSAHCGRHCQLAAKQHFD